MRIAALPRAGWCVGGGLPRLSLTVAFRVLALVSGWTSIVALGVEPEVPAATYEYGLQVFETPRPIRLHWIRVALRSDTEPCTRGSPPRDADGE